MEDITNLRQNNDDVCKYCNQKLVNNDFYILYRLIVLTNLQYHIIRLENIIEDLDLFVMNNGFHLSSTQLLLFRPDIIKEFLTKQFYPEEITLWFLTENEICVNCYKRYKVCYPEK
jgi:hypothetical protein